MDNIVNIATVSDYNAHWGIADRHPLVNVLEGSQVTEPIPNCLKNFGVYVVFLKDVICADYLKYGRQEYDFQENTLVFVSPGQVLGHPADGSTYLVSLFQSRTVARNAARTAHERLLVLFIRCP